jgi:AraC-like DNA-binding protein/uncharacterized membrane protein
MLYFIGIGINLFLILLLLSKKNKSLADKILLIWISTICLHLFFYAATTILPKETYVNLFAIAPVMPMLHGPLLYLYTASMTNSIPSDRRIWLIHFLPAIVLFILMVPFLLLPAPQKMDVVDNLGKGFEFQRDLAKYSIIVSGVVYVVWLVFLLRQHKENIKQQFSYDERIKLDWLKYLVYGLGVIWLIIIAQAINEKSYDQYIFGTVVLIVFVIGYFGIRQGRIYMPSGVLFDEKVQEKQVQNELSDTSEIPQDISEESETLDIKEGGEVEVKRKYAKSGLTKEGSLQLYMQLQELMEKEKVFVEPELTLVILAAKLSVHPNYLSQVINEKEGKNFYDYINNLRVEEFKRIVRLPENGKFTIMSLAYECGFNSKSSFNKNFKKVTGLSPSEFLNRKDLL